jgi:hypothetical protein
MISGSTNVIFKTGHFVDAPLDHAAVTVDAAVLDKIDKVGFMEEVVKMRAAGSVAAVSPSLSAVVALAVATFPVEVS